MAVIRPTAATAFLILLIAATLDVLSQGLSAQTSLLQADRPGHALTTAPNQRLSLITIPGSAPLPIRSLLQAPSRMAYGSFVLYDPHQRTGKTWVLIDLRHQLLSVFRDGDEIGTAVILYGMANKPTPLGMFPVLEKSEQHRSSLYDANMPYLLRLTGDGVAIHASHIRRAAATHGCIGVPPVFAKWLYARISLGDPVYITKAL